MPRVSKRENPRQLDLKTKRPKNMIVRREREREERERGEKI